MVISKPFVILNAAISIDGKIVTKDGDSKLSSRTDLKRVHKLRSQADAILIGKNTVMKDDPLLTVRTVKGKNPVRIILDSKGAIPSKSKILQTSKTIPTIIAVSKSISKSNLLKLKKFPVEVIFSGTSTVNLKSLLKILYKKKISKILVEGGGTVNWEFITSGLFDELFITISPYIIGGSKSASLVEGKGFSKILDSPKLSLKSMRRLKNHLVLHYVKL